MDQTSQQRREFNLQKTSQEIIRTMQGRINKQGHTLEIDIPDEIVIDSYQGLTVKSSPISSTMP